jgi:putative membrane protein
MMWEFGTGGGWMILMMILFWGGTIFLVMWGVRQFSGRSQPTGNRAMEVLEERYARGEITDKEFEAMRRTLADR